MNTLELQLKILRTAYRMAKSLEEKERIVKYANLLKHPPDKPEEEKLENDLRATVMTLPSLDHPYWDKFRK